ncbi:hypothetical protein ACLESO_05305 [Pyxidicoccus sp. 3LG]
MKTSWSIPSLAALLTLAACATTQGSAPAPEPRAEASADDELGMNEAELPNGVTESCKVVQRNADIGGKQHLAVAGGGGAFIVALPEAQDWKLQCDGSRLFWAFSKSARMQVSVNPYKPRPGEEVSPKAYLTSLGANMKAGMESKGLRVTNDSVVPLLEGRIFGLEMTLDAPEGQDWPLFPQDTFYTTRRGPGGYMFDAHVSTYPRTAQEREALRFAAHSLMVGFSTAEEMEAAAKSQDDSVADLTRPSTGPMPGFSGVSARNFSDQTLAAIKAALDCENARMGRYCSALDRFATSRALPPETQGVWAGSTLIMFAGEGGKLARAGEGLHHLYVKDRKGSFNIVKPSSPAEAEELRAHLGQIHSGAAPAGTSDLMRYLSTFTPMQVNPVETKSNSLSFIMGLGAELGVKEDQLPAAMRDAPRVFVRENDKEILVAEVWGEGHAVKVGIFPKN